MKEVVEEQEGCCTTLLTAERGDYQGDDDDSPRMHALAQSAQQPKRHRQQLSHSQQRSRAFGPHKIEPWPWRTDADVAAGFLLPLEDQHVAEAEEEDRQLLRHGWLEVA